MTFSQVLHFPPHPGRELTRAEHLEWCKTRARVYLDDGDFRNAWTSMADDLSKHGETSTHVAIVMGRSQLISGLIRSVTDMREFIEKIN